MDIISVRANLDHWQDIENITKEFNKSKFKDRIGCTIDDVKKHFIFSLTDPRFAIFLGYIRNKYSLSAFDMELNTIVLCHIVFVYTSTNIAQPRVFILGAYSRNLPGYLKCGKEVNAKIEQWAKDCKCDRVEAYVRNEAAFKALERQYGLKKSHTVIFKEVKTDG